MSDSLEGFKKTKRLFKQKIIKLEETVEEIDDIDDFKTLSTFVIKAR